MRRQDDGIIERLFMNFCTARGRVFIHSQALLSLQTVGQTNLHILVAVVWIWDMLGLQVRLGLLSLCKEINNITLSE